MVDGRTHSTFETPRKPTHTHTQTQWCVCVCVFPQALECVNSGQTVAFGGENLVALLSTKGLLEFWRAHKGMFVSYCNHKWSSSAVVQYSSSPVVQWSRSPVVHMSLACCSSPCEKKKNALLFKIPLTSMIKISATEPGTLTTSTHQASTHPSPTPLANTNRLVNQLK